MDETQLVHLTRDADLRRLHSSVRRAVFEVGPEDAHTDASAALRMTTVRRILVAALDSMAADYSGSETTWDAPALSSDQVDALGERGLVAVLNAEIEHHWGSEGELKRFLAFVALIGREEDLARFLGAVWSREQRDIGEGTPLEFDDVEPYEPPHPDADPTVDCERCGDDADTRLHPCRAWLCRSCWPQAHMAEAGADEGAEQDQR